jgi:hypothetical protein
LTKTENTASHLSFKKAKATLKRRIENYLD